MLKTLNVQTLRERLETERAELILRIAETETFLRAPIGNNPDPSDLAGQYASKERRTALLAQMTQRLEQVDAAIARMDAGTYGICTHCGEPIDPARLKALPSAAMCLRCQELSKA